MPHTQNLSHSPRPSHLLAQLHHGTSQVLSQSKQGDLPGALQAYAEAREVYEATGTMRTPNGAALLNDIGVEMEMQGDLPGALEAYAAAREVHEARQDGRAQGAASSGSARATFV